MPDVDSPSPEDLHHILQLLEFLLTYVPVGVLASYFANITVMLLGQLLQVSTKDPLLLRGVANHVSNTIKLFSSQY
jgi:hypothetical protein